MISDKIRLVRRLGSGGMGTVWLAEHLPLDAQVAVKFMSAEHARDPGLVERFVREAKIGARIRSPHVVDVFDYAATDDGVPYIVMELLTGEDLETRIGREGALGLRLTLRILIQVARALMHAHAVGIVHRDIKPDNIFLVGREEDVFVKILDFGIAKQEHDIPGLTTSGSTIGTPCYMSPEQLLDPKSVDERSDLWSLGVVVYHCLTGSVPFARESFGAICVAIHEGTFAPPSTLSASLPSSVDAWMTRALSRDADARFRSAEEMCAAFLEAIVQKYTAPRLVSHLRGSLGVVADVLEVRAGLDGTRTMAARRRARMPLGPLALLLLCAIQISRSSAARPDDPAPLGGTGLAARALMTRTFTSHEDLPPLNPTPRPPPERDLTDPIRLSVSAPGKAFAEPDLRALDAGR
jgi:serine/threonine-protein kinase